MDYLCGGMFWIDGKENRHLTLQRQVKIPGKFSVIDDVDAFIIDLSDFLFHFYCFHRLMLYFLFPVKLWVSYPDGSILCVSGSKCRMPGCGSFRGYYFVDFRKFV